MAMKAVLFDLDDTLVVDDAATEAAFLSTCSHAEARYGLDPQALTASVRQHARRLWQEAPTITYCRAIGISSSEGLRARFTGDGPHLAALRAWAPTYRRTSWARALAGFGIADEAFCEQLGATFTAERGVRHELFPDVAPVLSRLRRTHRLALVTNGSPDLQREKLAATQLARCFDAIVVSGEVDAGKPDRRPFALALASLGVRPQEAVMVGDSLERDVLGAQRAGLKGLWLNRTNADLSVDGIAPDGQLATLYPLLEGL